MGGLTGFGAALKFSLHIPVQWGMEKGEQKAQRENQSCHYLGGAAGTAEAEVEFSCLLLLGIVRLLIFLSLSLGPHPFFSFLYDNCPESGIILPNFWQLFPVWTYVASLGGVFSCCLLTVE